MPRPKQFDPDKILDQAMRLFWSKGYEATSIQDLVETLGINRFSLYDSFGDKRGLFIRSLERYTEQVFARSLIELEASQLGIEAIEHYFKGLAHWADSSLNRKGCLLVNTAVEQASHDRATHTHLKRQYERVELAFLSALKRAEAQGQLRANLDLTDRARCLVLVVQGCLVSMKALRHDEWVHSAARVMVADLRA